MKSSLPPAQAPPPSPPPAASAPKVTLHLVCYPEKAGRREAWEHMDLRYVSDGAQIVNGFSDGRSINTDANRWRFRVAGLTVGLGQDSKNKCARLFGPSLD
jgi:hypothetical protein